MANALPRLCLPLLLALPAVAAATPATPPGTDAPAAAAAVASPQDRSFINLFMRASLAATESGDLAARRGQHPLVRHYGTLLAQDFAEARRQLALIAGTLHLPPLPQEPDGEQKAAADRLQHASATDFDLDYLALQAQAHDDLLRVTEIEARTGDHRAVREFAAAMLPRVREYRLQSRVLVTLVREAASAPAEGTMDTITF